MAGPTPDQASIDDVDDPHRPIRIENERANEATRWGKLLALFQRLAALIWLAQGAVEWAAALTAKKSIFDERPASAAIAVVFFAVLDPVAGVGLWLQTTWGGVLWLLVASAQIFVAATLPGFFMAGYWLAALDAALIVLYFTLTFEAGRDYQALRTRKRRRRRAAPASAKNMLGQTITSARAGARVLMRVFKR